MAEREAGKTLWNTVWDSLLCTALTLFIAYVATDPNIEPVPKAIALLITATPLVLFGALWRFRLEDINLTALQPDEVKQYELAVKAEIVVLVVSALLMTAMIVRVFILPTDLFTKVVAILLGIGAAVMWYVVIALLLIHVKK